MNTILFGRAPQSLFGVYHPPRTVRARHSGVVLCYPFGQEYMRAHRAFRQLAFLLSGAGFHVMRFDYSGTGDSAGDGTSGTLAHWIEDARSAADELKDTAELSRVSFVGLRLGATVAALAATWRSDVDEVVLWEPSVSGAAYAAESLAAAAGNVRSPRADAVVGVLGFPFTPRLRAELATVDLRQVAAPMGSGRLIVVSATDPDIEELSASPAGPPHTQLAVVPSAGSWNEVDDYGGALIPVAHIQHIVAHLVRETS